MTLVSLLLLCATKHLPRVLSELVKMGKVYRLPNDNGNGNERIMTKLLDVHVWVTFNLGDHHCLNVMQAVSPGRNVYRDSLTISNSEYYHLIAYPDPSKLTVGERECMFFSLQFLSLLSVL